MIFPDPPQQLEHQLTWRPQAVPDQNGLILVDEMSVLEVYRKLVEEYSKRLGSKK